VKTRDFNYFFGEAMERNRLAGGIVRQMHSQRPLTSREEIHGAFHRELERLQPDVLANQLIELSRQVDAVFHTADRRGFRVEGRRTEMAELAAEMSELARATDHWLAEEAQTPLAFSLALIDKYRRVLVMLADSIKLPERADDAPKQITDRATLPTPAMN
jgi:hypothetical protein